MEQQPGGVERWTNLLLSGFESAHIRRERLDFGGGQFFLEGGHPAVAGLNGVDDFFIRGGRLPFGVGEIPRADDPAMKCPGAAIFAMTFGATFREQSRCVHLVLGITALLHGQGVGGGATRNQPCQTGNGRH
jgi:hypothetical protein